MTPEEIRNERLKLIANWLNAIASAIITVGTFIPIAQFLYGLLPQATDTALVYGSTIVCIGVGLIIHWLGHLVLGGLE